ncbi:hypothetical protein KKG05_09330 [bacterium]|nr:hypothetical protein [bacterium]
MKRLMLVGVMTLVVLLLCLNSSTAQAQDDSRKYGIEFRGGFSQYQVSDTRDVIDYYESRSAAAVTQNYSGPSGGFSLLWRQEKHFQWNIGYNSLMNFESEAVWNDTTLTLSSRASEFFVLGNFVFLPTSNIRAYFGGGVNFLSAKQDIRWEPGNSIFDGSGRTFGLLVNGAIELFLNRHVGLCLGGGYRLANVTKMKDVDFSGTVTNLAHPLVNRAWEADFSGPYAALGLRIYFDPLTKPIDFTD